MDFGISKLSGSWSEKAKGESDVKRKHVL